jgi:hypothetical protein
VRFDPVKMAYMTDRILDCVPQNLFRHD